MFHISSLNLLFSYGKVKDIFGGGQKEGVRGTWGEAQNEFFFFAKFPLLSKIQTLSHKLLVRQTSNHHHCNWHTQKPI